MRRTVPSVRTVRVTRAGGTTVCAYVVCECARIRESKALSHAGSGNKP